MVLRPDVMMLARAEKWCWERQYFPKCQEKNQGTRPHISRTSHASGELLSRWKFGDSPSPE